MALLEREGPMSTLEAIRRGLDHGIEMAMSPDPTRLRELSERAMEMTAETCEWAEVGALLSESMAASTRLDQTRTLTQGRHTA
ncbi:hypothetical protein [Demequina sp. NBRC 110055]|uniref:hypothetical protein n=1 Tax=Demequina sp. NBRC 110055 TaxID=1570344 RepID=UPI001356604E|nr:hypothetical protein [Demequina sp. NBRC 110055]